MSVRVLAFARVREILGFGSREFDPAAVATVGVLRGRLEADAPGLVPLRAATRIARNGELVDDAARLEDGDEVALLPPVGGG